MASFKNRYVDYFQVELMKAQEYIDSHREECKANETAFQKKMFQALQEEYIDYYVANSFGEPSKFLYIALDNLHTFPPENILMKIESLILLLDHPVWCVRLNTLDVLLNLKKDDMGDECLMILTSALVDCLGDNCIDVRLTALTIFYYYPPSIITTYQDSIMNLFYDKACHIRQLIPYVLGKIEIQDQELCVNRCVMLISDKRCKNNNIARRTAMKVLINMQLESVKKHFDFFMSLLKDHTEDSRVRRFAKKIITKF